MFGVVKVPLPEHTFRPSTTMMGCWLEPQPAEITVLVSQHPCLPCRVRPTVSLPNYTRPTFVQWRAARLPLISDFPPKIPINAYLPLSDYFQRSLLVACSGFTPGGVMGQISVDLTDTESDQTEARQNPKLKKLTRGLPSVGIARVENVRYVPRLLTWSFTNNPQPIKDRSVARAANEMGMGLKQFFSLSARRRCRYPRRYLACQQYLWVVRIAGML